MSTTPRFLAATGRAALIGLPGIAVLPFTVTLPDGIPPAALLVNPVILLALAALAGAWAAPRAGLRSALILGSPVQLHSLAASAAIGLALGLAIAIADHAAAGLWSAGSLPSLREDRTAGTLLLGLLYGGGTEEVLLRWGLLSVLALGLSRLLPLQAALWTAAILAALVFALAHLPAVIVESGALTPPLVLRTLVWNGLLGLAFGIAFLRHGLEAAILAHMGTHIGFALAAL